MKRILLSALASVALSYGTTEVSANVGHHDENGSRHHEHHAHHDHHHRHHHAAKSAEEMVKECEERMEKVKGAGDSLPSEMKTKFDEALKKVGVEIEILKNPDMGAHHKLANNLCRHALKAAEQIVKKHEHQVAHEKKMEEKKAKAEERKARAEERKAKAAERKAKRDEERNARKAAHEAEKAAAHHNKEHAHDLGKSDLDHAKSEGADKAAPEGASETTLPEEKK